MHTLPKPGSALRLAGLILTAAVITAVMVRAATEFMLDLQVFQDAGRALLAGADLYSEGFPTRSGFRFIYPPFGAVVFLPLAPLGATVAQLAWTAATVVAVWAILAMAASRLQLQGARTLALALTGVALLFEPVRANIGFGQINIFLFLMVTADVLGFTPRRARGVLLGLAAGIKITPAAFGVLFLVRRDWASLARAVGTVAATIGLGHLIRPAESWHFWTAEFFLTERGGTRHFVPNQALSGLLARARIPAEHLDPPVYGFFLLVAAAATWGAWRLTRDNRPVDALLLVALGVFIASPVAVTHHWSGVVIAIPLLLTARRRPVRIAVAVLVLTHLIGTHYAYALTAVDPAAHVLQWLIGNAQGVSGIAAFAMLLGDAALGDAALGGAPGRRQPIRSGAWNSASNLS
ncbi:glycosyltransferase 87 family protein [Dietzia maris]